MKVRLWSHTIRCCAHIVRTSLGFCKDGGSQFGHAPVTRAEPKARSDGRKPNPRSPECVGEGSAVVVR